MTPARDAERTDSDGGSQGAIDEESVLLAPGSERPTMPVLRSLQPGRPPVLRPSEGLLVARPAFDGGNGDGDPETPSRQPLLARTWQGGQARTCRDGFGHRRWPGPWEPSRHTSDPLTAGGRCERDRGCPGPSGGVKNKCFNSPTITIAELLALPSATRLQLLGDLRAGRPVPRVVVCVPVLRRSLSSGGSDQVG